MVSKQTFRDDIRAWLNSDEDAHPDAIIDGFIISAEEWVSENIRCKHMIDVKTSTVSTSGRVALPDDWQELDLVGYHDTTLGELRYVPRDEYYNSGLDNEGRYTIIGNWALFNSFTTPGTAVDIAYYQSVPPLTDASNNWLILKNYTLLRFKVLEFATLYDVEDERGPTWAAKVKEISDKLEENHATSKASGSRLIRRMQKSFG